MLFYENFRDKIDAVPDDFPPPEHRLIPVGSRGRQTAESSRNVRTGNRGQASAKAGITSRANSSTERVASACEMLPNAKSHTK